MGRVFVVQNQHCWSREHQEFRPKFDMSSAEEFGELIYLLSPTASPFRSDNIIAELHDHLHDYGPEDHLLLVGNPALIGFCVGIAAHYSGGDVSLLQWSGKDSRYIKISAKNLFTS